MGGLFQLFWGRGGDFLELGYCPLFDLWWSSLELSWNLWVCHLACWCITMSINWGARSICMVNQRLIEVDLSAILDPFDSSQFILCPWVMSFFQKLCPAPFPPVSRTVETIKYILWMHIPYRISNANVCFLLSWWCHPTISSSVTSFSSCLLFSVNVLLICKGKVHSILERPRFECCLSHLIDTWP